MCWFLNGQLQVVIEGGWKKKDERYPWPKILKWETTVFLVFPTGIFCAGFGKKAGVFFRFCWNGIADNGFRERPGNILVIKTLTALYKDLLLSSWQHIGPNGRVQLGLLAQALDSNRLCACACVCVCVSVRELTVAVVPFGPVPDTLRVNKSNQCPHACYQPT